MARKRSDLGKSAEAQIAALMSRGGTAESISKALRAAGVKVSTSTVARRMREQRGDVRARAVRATPAKREAPTPEAPPADLAELADVELPLPTTSEVPEGASLEMLLALRSKADAAAQAALARRDLATFGMLGRLIANLSEAIRKATPPEKADPNENPDMLAAKERARAEFHKLVDAVLAP